MRKDLTPLNVASLNFESHLEYMKWFYTYIKIFTLISNLRNAY